MANIIQITTDNGKERLVNILRKCIQSTNLNFIIGSGCSYPAIESLGNVERDIQALLHDSKELEAEKIKYLFMKPIAKSSNIVSGTDYDDHTTQTVGNHIDFIHNILHLLSNRKNTILLKQTNVFTTNYDFFIKKAAERFGSTLRLNDGFNRNPKLDNQYQFSTSEFFTTVYNKGNLYNYKVEIPSINLIKLHGSMSWKKVDTDIIFKIEDRLSSDPFPEIETNEDFQVRERIKQYDEETGQYFDPNESQILELLKKFNDQFDIILPVKDKFRDTLLNRIYYE